MAVKRAVLTILLCLTAGLPATAEPPRAMSLLPDGHHPTFETGFNIDNPRFLRRAIAAYQNEATQAGMDVKPFELDWSELEPRPGEYDLDETIDRLAEYQENGWQPLIYLRAIDSDDLTIPAYLKGSEDAVSLSDVDVSAPEFIASYTNLLDVIVPIVRDYDGFAIMVANEPDNFLTPHPELTDQVVDFVTAARTHIHSLDDALAVGVALSNGFDHDDDADTVRPPLPHHLALINASDIAVYNFYCLRVSDADQPASVRDRIATRIDAAAGRDIIFQELGCPGGEAAGLTETFQSRFFELAYSEMRDTNTRVSVVFQLVDWTQATIEFYAEALRPILDAEPAFKENPDLIFLYLDQLSAIGIIDAKDGTPKPAWFVFLAALQDAQPD